MSVTKRPQGPGGTRKIARRAAADEKTLAKRADAKAPVPPALDDIAHLAGSVKGLPVDLSSNKKKYLKLWGYGRTKR